MALAWSHELHVTTSRKAGRPRCGPDGLSRCMSVSSITTTLFLCCASGCLMTRINSSHVQSRTVLMLQGAAQHLRLPSSNGRQAAIQVNHLTAHEVVGIGGKKKNEIGYFSWFAKALGGNPGSSPRLLNSPQIF